MPRERCRSEGLDGPVAVLGSVAWHLPSRCNEAFLASYLDAFDKLRVNHLPSRWLVCPSRVRFALNNYAQLVLNFA